MSDVKPIGSGDRPARVLKAPAVRRNEILDCAQRLFFERGYDDTTVNDVIAAAAISKGAFYHHFTSKEAMLEALAERMARDSMARFEALLAEPSLDAVGKMNALLAGARRMKVETAAEMSRVFDVLFRPENIVLYHRTERAVSAAAMPIFTRLIAQGMEEGVFDVPDAEATAGLILQLRNGLYGLWAQALADADRGDIEAAAARLEQWLAFYGTAVDRILGLADGTIHFVEPGFVKAMLAARDPQASAD